ncbi:hypothetical protein N799_06155 [Lysobacter arseniciresistens ZS79]|uniref:Uncharacterized protein n=1 Tax=Lysobacter arseniciresistens ZS79 TaxID=913325 RepID=A0A0A0F3E8_9GAMM|nr:hypothetical protein N799_06155 [Lysobacter arseniciresistens ZS79]
MLGRRPHPFLEHPERLEQPRRDFLKLLLINDAITQEQVANETAWSQTKTTPHAFTFQLVWGGAGMLARALVNAHEQPSTASPASTSTYHV